jgi:hypothetical protein
VRLQARIISGVFSSPVITASPRLAHAMSSELLTSELAAESLGISVSTLYDWLAQSDAGTFKIRGQPVTINYFQGGRRGQGRIQIEASEIERLKEAMRVRPRPKRRRRRRRPTKPMSYPGITVPLGRPDD